MGAAIYPINAASGPDTISGNEPNAERSATAVGETAEQQADRWAWVEGGDRTAVRAAEALLAEYEGWSPFDMTRRVLSELRQRPLPAFVVRPYYETWVGWGVDLDLLALALARVAMKPDVKRPLRLTDAIVRHYAGRLGLTRPNTPARTEPGSATAPGTRPCPPSSPQDAP